MLYLGCNRVPGLIILSFDVRIIPFEASIADLRHAVKYKRVNQPQETSAFPQVMAACYGL